MEIYQIRKYWFRKKKSNNFNKIFSGKERLKSWSLLCQKQATHIQTQLLVQVIFTWPYLKKNIYLKELHNYTQWFKINQNSNKTKAWCFQLQHFKVLFFFFFFPDSKQQNGKQLPLEITITKLIKIRVQGRINMLSCFSVVLNWLGTLSCLATLWAMILVR